MVAGDDGQAETAGKSAGSAEATSASEDSLVDPDIEAQSEKHEVHGAAGAAKDALMLPAEGSTTGGADSADTQPLAVTESAELLPSWDELAVVVRISAMQSMRSMDDFTPGGCMSCRLHLFHACSQILGLKEVHPMQSEDAAWILSALACFSTGTKGSATCGAKDGFLGRQAQAARCQ